MKNVDTKDLHLAYFAGRYLRAWIAAKNHYYQGINDFDTIVLGIDRDEIKISSRG